MKRNEVKSVKEANLFDWAIHQQESTALPFETKHDIFHTFV
jgi:hypothetical protein